MNLEKKSDFYECLKLTSVLGFLFVCYLGCSSKQTGDEGFESMTEEFVAPKDWRFQTSGGSYRTDLTRDAKEGKTALAIGGSGGACELRGATIEVPAGRIFRASMWIKPKIMTKGASVDLEAVNEMGVHNASFPKSSIDVGKDGWRFYRIQFAPESGAEPKQLGFCLRLKGEGIVIVDQVRLEAVNILPEYTVTDGGFENAKEEKILGWNLNSEASGGTLSINTDKPAEGRQCLRITGGGQWTVAVSEMGIPATARVYFDGYVRATSGEGRLKIEYFKGGEWLGQTLSHPISGGQWQYISLVSDPKQAKGATSIHVSMASEKGPTATENIVDFDQISVIAEVP